MNKLLKNKPLLYSLCIIITLILVVLGLYGFNDDFNKSVNQAFYNTSINIDKLMNGYSVKEIEDTLTYTNINLSDNLIYSSKEKLQVDYDELDNVKYFEVHAEVNYYLDNSLKEVVVDKDNLAINIILNEPVTKISSYKDQINYMDKDLGLLSINDLKLDDENLNKVYYLIDEAITQKLANNQNLDAAKKIETKIYEDAYRTILKDIEGSSLFKINIAFNKEA